MIDHFCTYFDHRYAAKGLAMWHSLKRERASAVLHVLCLNEACREMLAGLQLPDVHLHTLSALEAEDPKLGLARANRTIIEYYFTLTPVLPLYLFKTNPGIARLTYIDADLFFFADPQPILDELGDAAVGLIEHRFSARLVDREQYGRFNVGWLTFRRDAIALACLEAWREECLEWCYDRLEPGRFAEQKYLDGWPDRFPQVRIIQHRGANLAPWNLNRFELTCTGTELRIDGQPLLFFHAHGFQPASPGRPREVNLEDYGVEETRLLRQSIFDVYEKALVDATSEFGIPLALALLADQPRHTVFLREALEKSEADRAARLDAIHDLQRQLEENNADRAARLDAIHDLQRQLEENNADRAARLDVIHALQRQLNASVAEGEARVEQIRALQQQIETSEVNLTAANATVQTLRRRVEEIEAESATIRTQLAQARSRIETLELSRSWRWTRPARQILGRLVGKGS